MAARSDGRLVAGPVLNELSGSVPAELLWRIAPAGVGHWLLATGPDGRVFDVTLNLAAKSFDARPVAKLDDPQVFAIDPLAGGSFLAGTSPRGHLIYVRGGQVIAEAALPADSIFDILRSGGEGALVATGNPGRIYRVDLRKFERSGISVDRIGDPDRLAARGITLFGKIADRNVRRLARQFDGQVIAGSSPMGNIYRFPAEGGAPTLLQENHDGEVTDLLPSPEGDVYATIIYSSEEVRFDHDRLKDTGVPPPAQIERFDGRSVLLRFSAGQFPEVLAARNGGTFYHLARHNDTLLIAGGEEGQLSGYDLDDQLALDYAGSPAARLNDLEAVPGSPDQFILLHNNSPGLALLDFAAPGERRAETREIDLGEPGTLGAVRFDRLRYLNPADLHLEIQTSNGEDEREGWTAWTPMETNGDGWRAKDIKGRYLKLRIGIPAGAAQAQLGRASVYFLPENRRPQIDDFRILSPNYAIVPPAPDNSGAGSPATLAQIISGRDDDKRKDRILSAQVVPSPGMQAVFWSASAPEGDTLVATFSIRHDGDPRWTDIAVDTTDSYAQFDMSHLPEGVYFTRLVVSEAAPRPADDRLSVTYESDDLVVNHTPPDILDANVRRDGDHWIVSVHGRSALSLLDSLDADFNNGAHATTETPSNGIRDAREETFVIEEPVDQAAGANAVAVTLYDAAGNSSTRRLPLPH